MFWLHLLLSLFPPLHCLPPPVACCSTLLTLTCSPPPQDLLHSLQAPYRDQEQSTKYIITNTCFIHVIYSHFLSGGDWLVSTNTSSRTLLNVSFWFVLEHLTVREGSSSSHTPVLAAYFHPVTRSCTHLLALLFRIPAINWPS